MLDVYESNVKKLTLLAVKYLWYIEAVVQQFNKAYKAYRPYVLLKLHFLLHILRDVVQIKVQIQGFH